MSKWEHAAFLKFYRLCVYEREIDLQVWQPIENVNDHPLALISAELTGKIVPHPTTTEQNDRGLQLMLEKLGHTTVRGRVRSPVLGYSFDGWLVPYRAQEIHGLAIVIEQPVVFIFDRNHRITVWSDLRYHPDLVSRYT